MSQVLKSYENSSVKITVEERRDGKFIATHWNKDYCLEPDRDVEEFESFGGAVDKAFDWLSDEAEFYFAAANDKGGL